MKRLSLLLLTSLLLTGKAQAEGFTQCDDAGKQPELKTSQCVTVRLSLDHKDDSDQKVSIFVRKFPAVRERRGSLWLLAGSPGESGASFYTLTGLFHKTFPHLDILIPDHRGTGASSRLCPGEELDSLAGAALIDEEWSDCLSYMEENADYVRAFSITNAAKDLRLMINVMSGDGLRYVYGVSYGTQLALRLIQLDEVQLDGLMLDSLASLQGDKNYDPSNRSNVVNSVGLEILSRCQRSPDCAPRDKTNLAGQLRGLIKATPSVKALSQDLPDASLSTVLGSMLDVPRVRNRLPLIIQALANDNAAPLAEAISEVNNTYARLNNDYPNFGSSMPLTQVITSSENNLRPNQTNENIATQEKNYLFSSPLPALIAENKTPTYQKDEFYAELPKKLPKTIIFHGTLDTKTHYQAAQNHMTLLAEIGDFSFVKVSDAPHFVAMSSPTCFKKYASRFVNSMPIGEQNCVDLEVLLANTPLELN